MAFRLSTDRTPAGRECVSNKVQRIGTMIGVVTILVASASTLSAQLETEEKRTKAVVDVMKIEGRWNQAVAQRDAKTFKRILADDYSGTTSGGEVRTKTETINRLLNSADRFESLTPCDFDLKFEGPRVVVLGHVLAKMKLADETTERSFSYSRVYEKRKGMWLVIRSETNSMAAPCTPRQEVRNPK